MKIVQASSVWEGGNVVITAVTDTGKLLISRCPLSSLPIGGGFMEVSQKISGSLEND